MLIQYIMPIIIVGIAYGSIWCKLNQNRKRLKNHTRRTRLQSDALINEVPEAPKEAQSISSKIAYSNAYSLMFNYWKGLGLQLSTY